MSEGLYIEQSSWRFVGDWLEGSGCVEAITEAQVATP